MLLGPLEPEVHEVEPVDGLGLAPRAGPDRRLGVTPQRSQHPLAGDAAGGHQAPQNPDHDPLACRQSLDQRLALVADGPLPR